MNAHLPREIKNSSMNPISEQLNNADISSSSLKNFSRYDPKLHIFCKYIVVVVSEKKTTVQEMHSASFYAIEILRLSHYTFLQGTSVIPEGPPKRICLCFESVVHI